jgi:tetratricopeptide (TPR) repeat protein
MTHNTLLNYRLHLLSLAFGLASLNSPLETLAGEKPSAYTVIALAAETPVNRGITLFKQGQYEEALEVLQEAAAESPNDALTHLWLGLALEANKQPYAAMEAWRKCYGNAKWEPIADYLKGMSWWKMGYTKDAISYFNDALVNLRDGKAVNFKPAKEAIKQVNAGESVPPLSQWADLSTLTTPVKAEKQTPVKTDKTTTPTNNNTTATTSNKEPEGEKLAPGATPKPGRWVATISNGFKGDKLTFTVSADGKRIENVEFTGHWRSRSWRTEVLTNLDPPKPYAVAKGVFSAVQKEEKASMWWEFIGRFTTSTSAEGSYRCAFAGGENDTYKLKWTAKRVGP